MTVDLRPTLVGELVTLRPLQPDDWDALFAVASDPLIWEQHPDRNRYQEGVFREFFRAALETQSAFVAIDNKDGRIIGSSRYYGYDPVASEIEIGWSFLARSHWGGRYNGEMKALMLAHAFQFADHVIFVIGPDNIRSQRAVQKLGAVRVDRGDVRGAERVVYRLSKATYDRAAS